MNSVPEIRREKVFIPPELSSKEIQEKYGLPSARAYVARRKGFFVRNYSKKQVIIDPENFNPSISYSTAKSGILEELRLELRSGEHQRRFDPGSSNPNV